MTEEECLKIINSMMDKIIEDHRKMIQKNRERR